ncbi:hypothetical protein WT08_17825 [Burkholderia sp. MSMB1552]|uniref:Uncharacterized protein n=1 Tax=Burkholderia humptydooensis MSMB43 TaxID=441157 RepID=A0ABN0GAX3_9BURK|nr:hypothetical protein AQ610_18070 [Burkholderia humptydooensis]EIP89475.1 hypothetical protein A33K_13054 [Burkholderia humptydooensis MSMB43]KVN07338.1 hypothetical protein WT08_17825 [Burkholderia sp. MSMB1552]KWZ51705.1 hypothetical protein WS92_16720 [Burkholderia sp. MSMB1588]
MRSRAACGVRKRVRLAAIIPGGFGFAHARAESAVAPKEAGAFAKTPAACCARSKRRRRLNIRFDR